MKADEIRKLLEYKTNDFIGYKLMQNYYPVIPWGVEWTIIIERYGCNTRRTQTGHIITQCFIDGVILAEDGCVEGNFLITKGMVKFLDLKFHIKPGDRLIMKRIRRGKLNNQTIFFRKTGERIGVKRVENKSEHLVKEVNEQELEDII